MLYKTLSAAVYGIDANIIEVEVDVSGVKTNEDHFHTVGLPDAAVRESRDRVRAALKNCGYDIPLTHITINLAPADIRKEGSGFDLPMALGILGAYGGLNKKEVPDCLFVGELSLDGGVRGVRGALPIAIEARGRKISRLIVPELNAREAAMVGGVEVYPVRSLLDVIRFVNTGNGVQPLKVDGDGLLNESQHYVVDFKDVRGQQTAKRAALVQVVWYTDRHHHVVHQKYWELRSVDSLCGQQLEQNREYGVDVDNSQRSAGAEKTRRNGKSLVCREYKVNGREHVRVEHRMVIRALQRREVAPLESVYILRRAH